MTALFFMYDRHIIEFIVDNQWIIFVSILALVTYTKVWYLEKRVKDLENKA